MDLAETVSMTPDRGFAQILLVGAAAFALILLRQLRIPQPRHHRWQRVHDLVSTGGLVLFCAIFAALFGGVIPPVVGIPIVVVWLIAWPIGSSYASRKASEEDNAFLEDILAGKYDRGGYR